MPKDFKGQAGTEFQMPGLDTKRFRIAFSFAGEKRDFVAKVAALLAKKFRQDKILYDKYHEAEFARYDLGIYLPKLYRDESDLVVAVICPNLENLPEGDRDQLFAFLNRLPRGCSAIVTSRRRADASAVAVRLRQARLARRP